MKLNDPLALVSLKLIGVGFDISLEKVAGIWHLCLTIDALAWSKCWMKQL